MSAQKSRSEFSDQDQAAGAATSAAHALGHHHDQDDQDS